MFGRGTHDTEISVNRLYKAFKSTAARYHYTFTRPVTTVGGKANVIFLGNHSSGKSSLINSLLGDTHIQDTGVAPTDDGFTVIMHGAEDSDFYGPAALGRLPAEFAALATFGPEFLQRLRVKIRNCDYLKNVNLIDSPGMIDAAEGTARRTYDFPAVVRSFAELSDLVFFLFDADKPGTTGETVAVLRRCLFGIEFKLRVLLNKADTFDSMYDFARAYGTLCWNLARVLRSKDLPIIYTTYTPGPDSRMNAKIDLNCFDQHRAQILELLANASSRRLDSVLAAVQGDFTRLSIQTRVLGAVRRRLFLSGAKQTALFAAVVLVVFLGAWFASVNWFVPAAKTGAMFGWHRLLAYLITVLAVGVAGFATAVVTHFKRRRFRAKLINTLDAVFEDEYAETLALGVRDDLRQYWNGLRDDIKTVLTARLPIPLFGWGTRRRLDDALYVFLPEMNTKRRAADAKGAR